MITKFIEPWVLIPGNLIILLACGAPVLGRTRRRLERLGAPSTTVAVVAWGMAVVAALLYLASAGWVADRVVGHWENRVPPAAPAELATADAVVVLGGGVVWRSPSEDLLRALDGSGAERPPAALSAEAESRLLYGARLAKRLELPLVVTGGRVLSAPAVPTEADVAAALARELLGNDWPVLREDASRTTAENAANTAARFDLDRVVLVTSATHMRRAVMAFRAAGLEPVPAPTAYRRDRRPFRAVMLVPDAGSLDDTATVFREFVGTVWYRIVLPAS